MRYCGEFEQARAEGAAKGAEETQQNHMRCHNCCIFAARLSEKTVLKTSYVAACLVR